MQDLIAEIESMEKRMAEIKALCVRNASEREATGFYDDELLRECFAVLEYATYHDGRYRQVDSMDKFQFPAQKLVQRLAKRLGVKPYDA
jgi:hypothetical protein